MLKLIKFSLLSGLMAVSLSLPGLFPDAASILTLNQMGIAIILAISYNLLLGKAGLLSLGQAVYFGFGGFFSVHVIHMVSGQEGLVSAPLIPLFGGIAGLVMAFVFGSFTTKRGGLIFAMLSFAMAELILASSTVFGRYYGGSLDRTEIPAFAGFTFQSDAEVFYLVWFWVVVVVLIAASFNASPLGRMATAVGQNSDRVEYLGYSRHKLRYLTFCLSGFLAGIGGGLFALSYEFVTVEIISLQQSWLILQMVFIGGVGYFWGPPLGAVLLTLLFSGLSGLTELWYLYTGIVFMAIVLFAPQGLTGLIANIVQKIRQDSGTTLLQSYALCSLGFVAAMAGLVGLCEMIYFLKNPLVSPEDLLLFGFSVNPHGPGAWAGFAILLFSGIWLARAAGRKLGG
jgi:branched-chain amino acid transport system permease protein